MEKVILFFQKKNETTVTVDLTVPFQYDEYRRWEIRRGDLSDFRTTNGTFQAVPLEIRRSVIEALIRRYFRRKGLFVEFKNYEGEKEKMEIPLNDFIKPSELRALKKMNKIFYGK